MADETNAAWKPLSQVWHQRVGGVLMEFSARAFLALRNFFGGTGSLNFQVEGALVNHALPGWSVRCCVFPCGDVDV